MSNCITVRLGPKAEGVALRAIDIELTQCDLDSASLFAALESVAFPFPDASLKARIDNVKNHRRCPIDRHFLARVGGSVVGGFRIMPLEMRVSTESDGWIQVGGLGRLGVYPHFRRQGLAGGVIRLVLQQSYEQGDLLSLLYPTSFGLYRRYGYALASRHVLYCVPPGAFPDDVGRERIRPATPADVQEINHCYENQLYGALGLIRRSARIWRDSYLMGPPEEPSARWVYVGDSGQIEGYLATVYNQTANFAVQRLEVREWFVTSGAALRAFMGFFRAQSSSIELVQVPAQPRWSLEGALVEPVWPQDPDVSPWRQPLGKICSTLVGRIIHLDKAIAARGFAEDGRINLLVEDWGLPVNSGYRALCTEGGRGELRAAEEGLADVRLDISVLSSLYCGATTARQALIFGQLEASPEAAEQLDRMLGDSSFMVWDYF